MKHNKLVGVGYDTLYIFGPLFLDFKANFCKLKTTFLRSSFLQVYFSCFNSFFIWTFNTIYCFQNKGSN